ncbi:hypothetical protein JD844_023375 [Phrynosoma platyrhinos]|uniref:Uncharacterized protein n=1 Tax=Phrynosoma platyrhinos TaxID=52577 RepID=A0ABQ7SWR5_PHRPL|nr:hypothetical protein JD844_023375 [Phrynosoma platyrhinos]
MSLIIRNLQRAIPIRRVPLRKNIEQLRCILGVQQFDLGVICVSNRHIQQLNRTYRQKNIPTDILSFPFHEARFAYLLYSSLLKSCEALIIFSSGQVTVAHGMCHLLGYKHSTKAEWKEVGVLLDLRDSNTLWFESKNDQTYVPCDIFLILKVHYE